MRKTIQLISLGFLVGCAKAPAPIAPQAQVKKELPVICRLVGRDQEVTISAGGGRSVYSVNDASGKALLSYANREELRREFPVLSHQLDSAIADIGPLARD